MDSGVRIRDYINSDSGASVHGECVIYYATCPASYFRPVVITHHFEDLVIRHLYVLLARIRYLK